MTIKSRFSHGQRIHFKVLNRGTSGVIEGFPFCNRHNTPKEACDHAPNVVSVRVSSGKKEPIHCIVELSAIE